MKKKCPEGVHDIEDCFSVEFGKDVLNPDPSMVQFDSGATRSAEPMEDPEGFFSPFVMDEYIKYMAKNRKQADGQIRSSDNWQNGMSKARYMRALFRHFLEAWRVWRRPKVYEDELIAGLCGVIFNAQGMILELLIKRGDIERPAIRSEEG
jgi:hypothetical protein